MNDLDKVRKRMKQRHGRYRPHVKNRHDRSFHRLYRFMIHSMLSMVLALSLLTYIKAYPQDIYVRQFILQETHFKTLSSWINTHIFSYWQDDSSDVIPVSGWVNYEWIEGNYYRHSTNQVVSINQGTVQFKGNQPILEDYIIVLQDDGIRVVYGHLNDIQVDVYDRVERGTLLASYQDRIMLIFEKGNQEITYEQALGMDEA